MVCASCSFTKELSEMPLHYICARDVMTAGQTRVGYLSRCSLGISKMVQEIVHHFRLAQGGDHSLLDTTPWLELCGVSNA